MLRSDLGPATAAVAAGSLPLTLCWWPPAPERAGAWLGFACVALCSMWPGLALAVVAVVPVGHRMAVDRT